MIETPQHRSWQTKLRNSTKSFQPDWRYELPSEARPPTRSSSAIVCGVLVAVNKGARTTEEVTNAVVFVRRVSRTIILGTLKLATYYGLLVVRVQPLPQRKWRFVFIQPGRNFEGRYKPNLTLEECNERWVNDDATQLRRWWS